MDRDSSGWFGSSRHDGLYSPEENGLQNRKRWWFTIISSIHLPPWKFTCVYSCLVQFINVMQCFPAFLPIIKEICLVTFNLICFVSFASNYLKPSYFSNIVVFQILIYYQKKNNYKALNMSIISKTSINNLLLYHPLHPWPQQTLQQLFWYHVRTVCGHWQEVDNNHFHHALGNLAWSIQHQTACHPIYPLITLDELNILVNINEQNKLHDFLWQNGIVTKLHGSSFFGLSDVKITISLLSVAIFDIIGLFPLSPSPLHPTTVQSYKSIKNQ